MKRMLVALSMLLMAGFVQAPEGREICHEAREGAVHKGTFKPRGRDVKRVPSNLGKAMRKASATRSASPDAAAAAGRGVRSNSPRTKRMGSIDSTTSATGVTDPLI